MVYGIIEEGEKIINEIGKELETFNF